MSAVSNIRKGIAYSLLAASAFASSAAMASSKDELGFYKEPICDELKTIQKSTFSDLGVTPSGLKAKQGDWDLEIYSNKETGAWMLVGQRKTNDPYKNACVLAQSTRKPYAGEKWYSAIFQNGTAPKVATLPVITPATN